MLCLAMCLQCILPKEEQLSRELQSLTSRKPALQQAKLRKDFELIERKASFKSLQDVGLFNDQNRLVFRRLLADIQQMSGVVSASYEISPGSDLAPQPKKRTMRCCRVKFVSKSVQWKI